MSMLEAVKYGQEREILSNVVYRKQKTVNGLTKPGNIKQSGENMVGSVEPSCG